MRTCHATVTYHNKQINDIICNWCYMIWIYSRNGLSANGSVHTSGDHHDHVFQFFIMAYIVLVKWRMKCNIMRFQESVAFDWYRKKLLSLTRRLKMDIQERTSLSCSGVNCQHAKLYGFNTIWESLIWFQQGISETRVMRKIGTDAIIPEATRHVGNLSSRWASLKWDLIFMKGIWGLIHKFSRSINLFSTTFCLNSKCVKNIILLIYLFDPNYRTVVMASIQILLAKLILDMAYFRHYHFCGHILSIVKIYNPEETCCYARPASVIANSNTQLKNG